MKFILVLALVTFCHSLPIEQRPVPCYDESGEIMKLENGDLDLACHDMAMDADLRDEGENDMSDQPCLNEAEEEVPCVGDEDASDRNAESPDVCHNEAMEEVPCVQYNEDGTVDENSVRLAGENEPEKCFNDDKEEVDCANLDDDGMPVPDARVEDNEDSPSSPLECKNDLGEMVECYFNVEEAAKPEPPHLPLP